MATKFLTTVGVHYRALLYVLRRLPGEWRVGVVFERARVVFLRDVARGLSAQAAFLLAMRGAGIAPDSPHFGASLAKYQGFARDAGLAWEGGAS